MNGKRMLEVIRKTLLAVLLVNGVAACGGSDQIKDAIDDIQDAVEITQDPPERRPIDVSKVGVNAFFNIPQLGTIDQQFSDIRGNLNLRFTRVLVAWTNGVQPSPNATPNYNFFDDIIEAIPSDVDVLLTIAHQPDWMTDPANWIDGDPIKTWVQRWFEPTVRRYANRRGVIAYQVFNEPDNPALVPADGSLNLIQPENYFNLLQRSSAVVRQLDPTALIVLGSTRSIQQDGGANLDYNERLRDLGAEDLVDIWGIHYYGKQYEKVILDGGVADFLNGLRTPVWVTESGERGQLNQLAYAETTWPFLLENIPSIQRIYYYQYGDTDPADVTFALRTPSSVSDLYISLRDR